MDISGKQKVYQAMIATKILGCLILIHHVLAFTFLYDGNNVETIFMGETTEILAVEMPLADEFVKSEKQIFEVYAKINGKYILTNENIEEKSKTDNTYAQLFEILILTQKYKAIYDEIFKFKQEIKNITALTTDRTVSIRMDLNYLKNKLINLKTYGDSIRTIFDGSKDIESLTTQSNGLVTVTAELLTTDLKNLVDKIAEILNTFNLSFQKITSPILLTHIFESDIEAIDRPNIKIIEVGNVDGVTTIYVKIVKSILPKIIYTLTPVAYYSYSLQNGYYFSSDKKEYFKLDNIIEGQTGSMNLTECLIALEQNNVGNIIQNCFFIPNDDSCTVTNEGVLFHDPQTLTLTEIKDKFSLSIKEVPFFLKFNGTLNIIENHLPKSIKMNIKQSIQYGSLTDDNLSTFYNKVYPLNTTKPEEGFFDFYFIEEIDNVLFSAGIFSIISLIFWGFKKLYFHCYEKKFENKPVTKYVNKKIMLQRRAKK